MQNLCLKERLNQAPIVDAPTKFKRICGAEKQNLHPWSTKIVKIYSRFFQWIQIFWIGNVFR